MRRPVLLVALLLSLSGCTPARMSLAPALAPVQPLEVRGRQSLKWSEGFTFGPWAVSQVDRGWKSTTTWNIIGISSASVAQKFEFTVARDGKPALRGQAATNASQKELEGYFLGKVPFALSLDDTATLAVSFLAPGQTDGATALRLLLAGAASRPLRGGLRLPDGTVVTIQGTNAFEGSPFAASETIGYSFERSGAAVGAVEVMNDGRLWLSPGLSEAEREGLAAAAAALLLYRGPDLPSE